MDRLLFITLVFENKTKAATTIIGIFQQISLSVNQSCMYLLIRNIKIYIQCVIVFYVKAILSLTICLNSGEKWRN